jgi:Domain of unknown function (DUF4440)
MCWRILLCCLCSLTAVHVRAAADQQTELQSAAVALPKMTQALFDSVAPGDKTPWTRYLSAKFVEIDESGARLDKNELLKDFGPLPQGMSGTIAIQKAQVSDFGEFAVMRYDLDEHENVFGQQLHVIYRATDTWRREEGRWRLVASQTMTVAQDPPPLPAGSTAKLSEFAGLYDMGGQRHYRVEQRGDDLVMGREGKELQPLIRVGDNVFVAKGDALAILYIFVRGPGGRAEYVVERRKFADLKMMRVDAAATPPRQGT